MAASVLLCFIGIKILTIKRILLETKHELEGKRLRSDSLKSNSDIDTLIKGKQIINESESESATADFKRVV